MNCNLLAAAAGVMACVYACTPVSPAKRLVVRTDYDVPAAWTLPKFLGRDFHPLFKPDHWSCPDAPEWAANPLGLEDPPLPLYSESGLMHDGVKRILNEVVREPGFVLKRGPGDYRKPVKLGDFFERPARKKTLYSNPRPDKPVFLEIQNARPAFLLKDKYDLDLADYAAWKAAHTNFVGLRCMAEVDNDFHQYNQKARREAREKADPVLAAEIDAKFPPPKTQYDWLDIARRQVKQSEALRFGETNFWTMHSASFSTAHQMADAGAAGLFYEATSEQCGRWQIAGAFLRGACRQFSVPMGWYTATWCTGFTRDGEMTHCANSMPAMADKMHRPLMGAGRNSTCRQINYAYLIGTSFIETEGYYRTHYCRDDDSKPPTKPSGYAHDLNDLYLSSSNSWRGVVYSPCAILFPLSELYLASGVMVFGGEPFALNSFFYTLAPIYSADVLQRDLRRRGLQSCLFNSEFGEFYDVLAGDSRLSTERFAKALSPYKCAFLAGVYRKQDVDVSAFEAYVRGGGTLFVSADQVSAGIVPESLSGVAFGTEREPSGEYLLDDRGGRFPLKDAYSWMKPQPGGAARPAWRDEKGNVAVFANDVGRGRVFTVACRLMMPAEYEDASRKILRDNDLQLRNKVMCGITSGTRTFELIRRLLLRVQDETLPVAVEGDVQGGVNRTKEGWLVWLFNNDGVTKFSLEDEQFDQSKASKVRVRQLSTGETREAVVPPGGIRFVRFRSAGRTK